MSNVLSDQHPNEQDAIWRAERDRRLTVLYYQPAPPVDQSAISFYRPKLPTDQSNAVPAEIAVCWQLLKESHLSDEAFTRLVSAASSRVTRPDTGLRTLNSKSLAGFLHYWGAVSTVAAEPEIAISPKGNIQTEWTKDESDFLVMEFQPNGEIFFSLCQEGYQTEGVKSATRTHELLKIFEAMDENPLAWSDAA